MKLLKSFSNRSEAANMAARLKRKGVMVFVSSEHSRALSSVRTGAMTSEVWVVLDAQYEDALQLLQSSSQVVAAPLTDEEMRSLEVEMNKALDILSHRILNFLLVGGLLLFICVVVYSYWRYA